MAGLHSLSALLITELVARVDESIYAWLLGSKQVSPQVLRRTLAVHNIWQNMSQSVSHILKLWIPSIYKQSGLK